MIREPILFRPFFSLLLLLSFSPFCTYEPTSQIHPRPSGLPTHPQRPGDVPLDPKEEGRSGRLAEKALYCALEEIAHRFFRAPDARRSDCVCAPCGRAPRGGSKLKTAPSAKSIQQKELFLVCLTTHFAATHGRTLGSPSGRAGETPARAARLRGEPPPRAGELSSGARLRGYENGSFC